MAATLDGFDLESLLAPISEAEPAGADPRQDFTADSLYYRLRDARAEARAAERQADAADEAASPAQWAPIRRLAIELLSDQVKDLEVAAWCTEALLRSDGLAGAAAGFALMRGLVESYWDDLHPLPDEEDGMARRVAPVAGLSGESGEGTLIQPLRKLIVFERRDGTEVPFWSYQQSAELAGIGDPARREQRIAAGIVPFEQMEADARAAGGTWFALLRRAAGDAAEEWQALAAALDQRAGTVAPPTSRVRDLLAEIAQVANRYAPAEAAQAAERPESNADARESVTEYSGSVSAPVRISSREEAFQLLDRIAEFFRRTEPHSPLAYTLSEAVRRGRLTWPELLEEIVPDLDNRAAILLSLGIRPPLPPE